MSLLEARDIETCYGASQVLFGMSFDVKAGEVVTLLGRNGMGKSTLVKSVTGLLAPRRGTVRLAGVDLAGRPPHHVARAGIGLVPEGRRVFPNLSVRENLVATAANRHAQPQPWTLERIYGLFPRLRERERNLACNLSGGEQQMLAIGRALMTNPRLLILDEATEGLAPLIRREIWNCLAQLKAAGHAMVVIDKNIGPLLRLADRHFIVAKGRTMWSGTSAQLRAEPALLHTYVGL
ncbi:ABC transporter ATP-binding protein [Variovorax sp. YR216]|uniref:ABC transporter ATP-binding protein n=1 Tax=Variovorax sp. YR216 TaxID=1882828 RepID=UPI00089A315F|nr:ABC transporter ATP-binding protein [Variovorax sp. YR216]SEB05628.1 amino acid/amide ABC transporter ATP-binding protein 2, HAAT family [Variovorax sp. YR216]